MLDEDAVSLGAGCCLSRSFIGGARDRAPELNVALAVLPSHGEGPDVFPLNIADVEGAGAFWAPSSLKPVEARVHLMWDRGVRTPTDPFLDATGHRGERGEAEPLPVPIAFLFGRGIGRNCISKALAVGLNGVSQGRYLGWVNSPGGDQI